MRKIFIDGGANIGQSTKIFLSEWPNSEEYEIYMFEPISNPELKKLINENKNIKLHEKAIWTIDKDITFYIKNQTSEGNTVMKEKVDISSANYKQKTVDGVSLSKYLKKNFNIDDEIILKLDIEGAEYEVLKDMVEKDSIKYINTLFCEIHGLKCGKKYEETVELVQLCVDNGAIPYVWDANKFKYKTYKKRVYNKERIDFEYNKWKKRGL